MKTLLIVLCAGLAIHSHAQFERGSVRVGPTLAINNSTSDVGGLDLKTRQLNFGMHAGYYVVDQFEIGLAVVFLSSKTEFLSSEITSSGLAIGPAFSYILKGAHNFHIPFLGAVAYNVAKEGDDERFTGITFALGTGVEYLVARRLGARLSLAYEFGTIEHDDSPAELDIGAFTTGIGVHFYFGGPKADED